MKNPVRSVIWDAPKGFWSVRLVKGITGPYAAIGGRFIRFADVVWC